MKTIACKIVDSLKIGQEFTLPGLQKDMVKADSTITLAGLRSAIIILENKSNVKRLGKTESGRLLFVLISKDFKSKGEADAERIGRRKSEDDNEQDRQRMMCGRW